MLSNALKTHKPLDHNMLQRHHELTDHTSASILQSNLKALSLQDAKKAEEIRKEIKALEQELAQLLGVNCQLKIVTKP